MRKSFAIALLLFMLAPAVRVQVAAQDYSQSPVEISKEKVRRDGKVYYSHVVQEKQTLFSIAKAYGVAVQDIYDANPALNLKTNGLKKNQIIFIPYGESASAEKGKVKEKETGKETSAAPPAKRSKKDEYFVHVVKWYEDLSDIAGKYGVSEESIMSFNGMNSPKVRKKMRLKIPYAAMTAGKDDTGTAPAEKPGDGTVGDEPVPAGTPVVPDTLNANETSGIQQDTLKKEDDEPWYRTIFTGKSTVDITLLLPINARGKINENFVDFYGGFLLALKESGENGTGAELSVYDVADGSVSLTSDQLGKSDVIIGPVSKEDISKALDICPEKTLLVSPLDPVAASLAQENKNLVQAPTPSSVQYMDVVNWVRTDRGEGDRIVLISEKEARNASVALSMAAALDSANLEYTPLSYAILEGRNIATTLSGILEQEGMNRVIVASESEAFVADVVRNLNLMLHDKYPITLYSPSRIRTFNTIDIENLHNLNLHVSASYYIDYDKKEVKDFLMSYRALFNTEPSQFAFQGYDLASYFMRICSKYGKNWHKMLPRFHHTGLQADFVFTEYRDGGYVNSGIRRMVYNPDFSITPVAAFSL